MNEQTTLSGAAIRTLRATKNRDVLRAVWGDQYFLLRRASSPLRVTDDMKELLAAGLVTVSAYEFAGAHYVEPTAAGETKLAEEI